MLNALKASGSSPPDMSIESVAKIIADYLDAATESRSTKQIGGAIHCRRQLLLAALRLLRARGEVSITGRGKRGDPHRYAPAISATHSGTTSHSVPVQEVVV